MSNTTNEHYDLKMYDAKEMILFLLLKKGLSMRKLVEKMNEAGYPDMTIGGFSKMLKTKSIKYTKVQEILDFLGYELQVINKKKRNEDAEDFTLLDL